MIFPIDMSTTHGGSRFVVTGLENRVTFQVPRFRNASCERGNGKGERVGAGVRWAVPGTTKRAPPTVFSGLGGGEVFVRVCRAAMDMDSDRD